MRCPCLLKKTTEQTKKEPGYVHHPGLQAKVCELLSEIVALVEIIGGGTDSNLKGGIEGQTTTTKHVDAPPQPGDLG